MGRRSYEPTTHTTIVVQLYDSRRRLYASRSSSHNRIRQTFGQTIRRSDEEQSRIALIALSADKTRAPFLHRTVCARDQRARKGANSAAIQSNQRQPAGKHWTLTRLAGADPLSMHRCKTEKHNCSGRSGRAR